MHTPTSNCPLCPRLVAFREQNRAAHPTFFNGAVPAFGAMDAKLLVVGLAPGLKGANATGRPFTGDFAGDILYASLATHGLATGHYKKRPDDGFALVDTRVSNAVRCVPPENKPTPEEIKICNQFLKAEIAEMPNLRVILSLGNVSHGAVLGALGLKASAAKFGHAAEHLVQVAGRAVTLLDSYHTSRYNIQTRRLSQAMFDDVIARVRALMG